MHSIGPKIVIISSIDVSENENNKLTCVLSYNDNNTHKYAFLSFQKSEERLVGTGDAFVSILLSNLHSIKKPYFFDDIIVFLFQS